MIPIDNKTDKELLQSLLAEVAKARNEIKCAEQDIKQANNRISFSLVMLNTLLARNGQ